MEPSPEDAASWLSQTERSAGAFEALVTIKLLAPEESADLIISDLRTVQEILHNIEQQLIMGVYRRMR